MKQQKKIQISSNFENENPISFHKFTNSSRGRTTGLNFGIKKITISVQAVSAYLYLHIYLIDFSFHFQKPELLLQKFIQ